MLFHVLVETISLCFPDNCYKTRGQGATLLTGAIATTYQIQSTIKNKSSQQYDGQCDYYSCQ